MKPNFALNLSHEGISLLQRADAGWLLVGEVSLQDDEFNNKINALRQTANTLDAGDVVTKLVIPNSQILFRQVDAPGPDGLQRNLQIRQALDGATPYDVDDLAYDWCDIDGQIHVAAVAKETLKEAEDFALEHNFNPLSFVAIPDHSKFSGEPYFGTSKNGQNLLGGGGAVMRDTQAIVVTGAIATQTPKIEPEVTEEAAPKTAPEPAQIEPPNAKKTDIADIEPEADQVEPDTVAQTSDILPVQEPISEPADPEPATPEVTAPEPTADIPPEPPEAEITKADLVKPALDAPAPASPEPVAPIVANVISAELPKADAPVPKEDAPVFSSRRDNTADSDNTHHDSELDKLQSRLAVLPDGTISRAPKLGGASRTEERSGVGPAPETKNPPETPPVPKTKEPVVSKPEKKKPKPKKTPAREIIQAAAKTSAALPARTGGKTSDQHAPTDEKQKMTVFGARKIKKAKTVKGKPRFLGLGLLLALLLFFAIIILWSSYYLNDGVAFWRNNDDTQTAQAGHTNQPSKVGTNSGTDPVGNAVAMLGEPTISAPALLTLDDAAPLPQEAEQQEPPTDVEPEPEPDVAENTTRPELPTQSTTPLSVAQAQNNFDNTGVWQRAPDTAAQPKADNTDDIYLTSVDPNISWQDAVSLPIVSSNDSNQPLDNVSSPANHNTRFVLDERGLVVATPQGSLTPDGVMVFAGAPSKLPARRPNTLIVQTPAEPETRLTKIRPKARPSDLVEQTEAEQLGGRSRSELAAFRPKPRPATLKIVIAEPEATVEEKPEVVEPEVVEELDPTPSAQAVVLSRFPNHRPRNFTRIVTRARASAPSTTSTAAAAVPRSQTITPTGRTTASVARLATTKNALRLKRTSLIGVYGSPSKRRALVRLASGRYVKVKVGQRVDGGKVAAIGEHELRYVKGGRTIVLRMPKS